MQTKKKQNRAMKRNISLEQVPLEIAEGFCNQMVEKQET